MTDERWDEECFEQFRNDQSWKGDAQRTLRVMHCGTVIITTDPTGFFWEWESKKPGITGGAGSTLDAAKQDAWTKSVRKVALLSGIALLPHAAMSIDL